jgi:RNA polymerase sigma factor (sigma-70 family)
MTVPADIVAAHADAVWRTVYRLLNNHEDALDCYQQTFVDAMRLDGAKIQNWRSALCCVATRRAMDQLRRRYRAQNIQGLTNTELSTQRRPDQRMLDDELRSQIREALATLPQQQAEAFWLRHIEQLDSQEIASQMKLQPGNVRVLVHRAAEQLRQILGATYAVESTEGDSK